LCTFNDALQNLLHLKENAETMVLSLQVGKHAFVLSNHLMGCSCSEHYNNNENDNGRLLLVINTARKETAGTVCIMLTTHILFSSRLCIDVSSSLFFFYFFQPKLLKRW
jgi:hypothetical protein